MAANKDARILLVMSDSERKDLIGSVEQDYAFEATESVEEAQRLLTNDSYQVLIVDETLPAPGWRELSKFVRKNDIHVPMLICTGEVGSKEIFAESMKEDSHVVDVLIRPFDKDIVEGRIRAALRSGPQEKHKGATLPSHPLETGPQPG